MEKLRHFSMIKPKPSNWLTLTPRSRWGRPLQIKPKVNALCFSPDSRTLAAGYADATIRLWDVHSHEPLGPPLKGHDSEVSSLAFSPDGTILASGSWGNSPTIFLWDVKTAKISGPTTAWPCQGREQPGLQP